MPERADLAGVARDASTITEVLASFEHDGYRGHFVARAGGQVECVSCHTRISADEMGRYQLQRLGGRPTRLTCSRWLR